MTEQIIERINGDTVIIKIMNCCINDVNYITTNIIIMYKIIFFHKMIPQRKKEKDELASEMQKQKCTVCNKARDIIQTMATDCENWTEFTFANQGIPSSDCLADHWPRTWMEGWDYYFSTGLEVESYLHFPLDHHRQGGGSASNNC